MPTAHPLPRHKDAGTEDSTRVGWSIGRSDADQSYCCRVGAMGVVIAGVCRQTDLTQVCVQLPHQLVHQFPHLLNEIKNTACVAGLS